MTDSAPIVIALGGNAISPLGVADTIQRQFHQTTVTAGHFVEILRSARPVVITHGNGPQIGNVLRRIELSSHEVYPIPLDVCVADVQGGMGYMIGQCLRNELTRHAVLRDVSTVITSVEVDPDDAAFGNPTKPIGSVYPVDQADRLRGYGWTLVEIPGHGVRRVVASPIPRAIVEIDLIKKLVQSGEIIIAAGGGGVPVVRVADGTWSGREAVIDKDLASSLLARSLDAADLVIVTGVDRVSLDFGTPAACPVARMTAGEARTHLAAGQFPPGSMGPKIRAAIEFLEADGRSGRRVVITDIDHLSAAMAGEAGTTIVP